MKNKWLVLCLIFILLCLAWFILKDRFTSTMNYTILDLGLSNREMIKISRRRPVVYINAYPFRKEVKTPKPIFLDGNYELEFVPIQYGIGKSKDRIETYLILNDEEKLINTSSPLCLHQQKPGKKSNRFDIFDSCVHVDLNSYRKKHIFLKWIFVGSNPKQKAAIGNVKISPKESSTAKMPNILVICSDTHRYDYAFGKKGSHLMPGLKELKAQSTVYHNAYSAASWTLPSLVSFFTGLSPRYHRTGMRVSRGHSEELQKKILSRGQFLFKLNKYSSIMMAYPQKLLTFTEHLRELGYFTTMVISNPLYIMSGLYEDGHDIVINSGVVRGNDVNKSALRIIDSVRKDRPLFLLVHYMDVHHYYPWCHDATPSVQRRIECYEEAVRTTDENLGQLVDKWDAVIGSENSLIVFFSDHGEHLCDFGQMKTGHGNSMDDLLLHVPLLVKYPGYLKVGKKEINRPVSLIDVFPTILDVLGKKSLSGSCEGKSLLNIEGNQMDESRYFYADYQLYFDELSSVRQGNYKLIKNIDKSSSKLIDKGLPILPRGEFGQRAKNLQVLKKLQKTFQKYFQIALKKTKGLSSEHKVNQKEATKSLRSLGYIQ